MNKDNFFEDDPKKNDFRPIIRVCRNESKPKDTDKIRYRWCSCLKICKVKLRQQYNR